ncbi:transcription factor, putative [Ricinus communis]|uniref:Transcription factor, putative n=2 Tax=Ricinus communis TaxID=3988 RepID=B9RSD2_RICCO|nr:transcription factor, putative [Ricinus communis]
MDSKATGQPLMNIANKENPFDIDWSCTEMEETFQIMSELPPIQSCIEMDSLALPWEKDDYGFEGFEELDIDCSILDNSLVSWDEDSMIDRKPIVNSLKIESGAVPHKALAQSHDCASNSSMNKEENTVVDRNPAVNSSVINVKIESSEVSDMILAQSQDCASNSSMEREEEKRIPNGGRKRASVPLEFEEIQKHFDVPITKAAKEMKVGLTVLKKRCRELKIMRWPHRKIRSLESLINNVKEMGLTKEIVMLEEHRKLVEKVPGMELTERTKRLRQACFKANYKKKRCLAGYA